MTNLVEINLVQRIARDTIPSKRWLLLDALGQSEGITKEELSVLTGLPATTLSRGLQDLEALGLAETRRAEPLGRGQPPILWSATEAGKPPLAYHNLLPMYDVGVV